MTKAQCVWYPKDTPEITTTFNTVLMNDQGNMICEEVHRAHVHFVKQLIYRALGLSFVDLKIYVSHATGGMVKFVYTLDGATWENLEYHKHCAFLFEVADGFIEAYTAAKLVAQADVVLSV